MVSTIANLKAMRTFSSHLPSHKLGLWSTKEHSNANSNIFFEGQPWKVPAGVIAKLKRATEAEQRMLHPFY